MKTLCFALSLALLPSLLTAQSLEDLIAVFETYEPGTEITDEQLVEGFDKTIPKDLMKTYLLEYGGDWATLKLEDDNFQWHPLAHVKINDNLHVFAITSSEPSSSSKDNSNLVELITVFKEAYQDKGKMTADLDAEIDGTVNSVKLTIEEDKIYTVEYLLPKLKYEDQSKPYDLEALKEKALADSEGNLERYTLNKKGKLKVDYRWWNE